MTQAAKIAGEWAEKVLNTRWVDGEPFLSYIRRIAEREMEEACFAIHSIPREQRNKRAVCQRAIRARRWWEEEV